MYACIALVFAATLLISPNVVSGSLKCRMGTFHDTSGPGLTDCKPCSTCPAGSKVMSECRNDQDTVCCTKYCASDAYLDESACVCRRCTRTCPPNYRMEVHCGVRNNAECVSVNLAVPKIAQSSSRSTKSRPGRRPAGDDDQTSAPSSHRELTQVINPDSHATTPTTGLLITTVAKSPPQPHQTFPKHLSQSVSTSRATNPPDGVAAFQSTAGVTSGDLMRPLRVVIVIVCVIVVVAVASLLLCCKITLMCGLKRNSNRSVGVANDPKWRMQTPLNNFYADRPSLDVGPPDPPSTGPSPKARSGRGFPGSTSSIGSFRTSSSMTTDEEEIAIRIAEWECEPAEVWKSAATQPAAGKVPEGRGENVSFYPRPSMSMNNVYPEMSPAPSKVWINAHGQSKISTGHCCHQYHHPPECEQQQVCCHTQCMHDDYYLSSTFSIGSGCTV
ncbi:uncharacterized protein LOC117305298 [Asterias rubens]|uniref:uncharacterized protein LOC117305298 n=1 Tax=Asterias rubens TaxID=7604 RepID=UPI001455A75F|nr:uncharacterized protein LOC117305298 [Asterias rubens]